MPPPSESKSQIPALMGLREKLQATGVSRYALAEWLGVTPNTVRAWLRGMQGGHHIELLHDWIEGRIVARRTSSRRWAFVPAREVMSAAERLAHELLDAVHDGRAVVRPIPGGVEVVLKSDASSLTDLVTHAQDDAMEKVHREKRPGQRIRTTSVALYDDDRAMAEAEARRRGVTIGHFIRLAIREAGGRVNLAG